VVQSQAPTFDSGLVIKHHKVLIPGQKKVRNVPGKGDLTLTDALKKRFSPLIKKSFKTKQYLSKYSYKGVFDGVVLPKTALSLL